MTEKNEPFKFSRPTGDVGHTINLGPIGGGKTVSEQMVKIWSAGHPGGSSSVAQAGDDDGE
jgi:hypothetical protein